MTNPDPPLSLRRQLDRRTILHWLPWTGWRLETLPVGQWQPRPDATWPPVALAGYRVVRALQGLAEAA